MTPTEDPSPIDGPALTAEEAILGVALGAVWADGQEASQERRALEEVLRSSGPLTEVEEQRSEELARIAQEDPRGLLEASLGSLAPGDRGMAFALATDVVLADRSVSEEERALLDELRTRLDVGREQAQRTIDLMETKHATPLEPLDVGEPDPEAPLVALDLTPSEALMAFPLGALYAEHGDRAKAGARPTGLPPLGALRGLPTQERDRLIRRVDEGLDRWGIEAYVEACAEVLDEGDRTRAFLMATDTILSDRRASGRELDYLEHVREVLGITREKADELIGVVSLKYKRG